MDAMFYLDLLRCVQLDDHLLSMFHGAKSGEFVSLVGLLSQTLGGHRCLRLALWDREGGTIFLEPGLC